MNKDKDIQFVEQVLRGYKSLNAERINLNIKWSMLERQKHDAIEGQYLSAVCVDTPPGAPHGSYKASPVLLVSQNKEISAIEGEQSIIKARLMDIDDLLTVINTSINSLSTQDRNIVFWYYCERYQIEKIAGMSYLHPRKVLEHKAKSLWYLHKSMKILEGTVVFK
jgi:hypothetical protein